MKVSLSKWADRFDPKPHANTRRNWVRLEKIVPPPVKIGREYYVEPTARHINELIAAAANGSTIPLT